MSNDKEKPATWGHIIEALFTIAVGVTLTYFFFEPGKEAISGFVKSLLP